TPRDVAAIIAAATAAGRTYKVPVAPIDSPQLNKLTNGSGANFNAHWNPGDETDHGGGTPTLNGTKKNDPNKLTPAQQASTDRDRTRPRRPAHRSQYGRCRRRQRGPAHAGKERQVQQRPQVRGWKRQQQRQEQDQARPRRRDARPASRPRQSATG